MSYTNEFYTTLSAGYMGATNLDGSKSNKHLYGKELSSAVRADLREHLNELKKSDVNVSCKTYSMGQSLTVKIKLDRKYIKPFELEKYLYNPRKYFDYWLNRPDGSAVRAEDLYTLDDKDRCTLIEYNARQMYEHNTRDSYSVNHYHFDDNNDFITDAGCSIIKKALTIIDAYRYDHSNSMVDYFDTNFYYDVVIVWKD